MTHTFFSLLQAATGDPFLTGLVIVLATAIIEDPTTILVGVLSASGFIPVPLALVSLYIGIVIGDTALFGLGALARTRPRLASYVDHELVVPLRTWLETRFILTVFSVRFIPGMRVPTYAASGFFKRSFGVFVLTAVAATFVWTTLLFSVSYWFGALTHEWFASARWGIAGAALLLLFLVARHNVSKLNRKKASMER